MVAGGARKLNALQPVEAKERGGLAAGGRAAENGRLFEAAKKGGARSREIAAQLRAERSK
jgi:hypothetical protein